MRIPHYFSKGYGPSLRCTVVMVGDDAISFSAWLLREGNDDDTAVLWSGGACRYRELRARVQRAAALVRQSVDIGAIVPVVGASSLEWIVSYLGVLHAGAVPALIPPTTNENMLAVFAEVRAQLAFVDATTATSVSGSETTLHALGAEADGAPSTVPRSTDEMTALLYTSGSTGRPKGVMVSTANFIANAAMILDAIPLARADRAFMTLPLFYCYGLSVLHTHLRAGASLYLCHATVPEAIVDELAESQSTGFPSVPSLVYTLATRSSLAERAPSHLRYVMVSGGRLPDAMVDKLAHALPATALHVRYGVTELTAAASFLPPDQLPAKLGSIGHSPGLYVERADGHAADPDEVGELVVRGPSVTRGYFNDEELTRERFRDGAFFTGDLARVDRDGFIYITGRRAELIKTIGHRVSPAEIEEVLSRAPGVLETGVCGIPHPVRGEAIAAAVVLAADSTATPASLLQHCTRTLVSYKVPIKVVIVAELPRTPNRKLDRPRLATLLSSG